MQPQQNQPQQDFGGLNPDQIAAALSFATSQGEQHLPPPDAMNPAMQGQAPIAPQEPQNAPGQTEDPNKGLSDLEGKMEQKMEIMRTEVKDTIKLEIDNLRKTIEDALNNNE